MVDDRQCRGVTALQSRSGDRFFGLANGTVVLDSPDIANTMKIGVHRVRAGGPDREETRDSGSHGRAMP
jgi:hypothetical protein